MVAWDSQSGASAATPVAYGAVPTILPETRQDGVFRASQPCSIGEMENSEGFTRRIEVE